MSMEAAWADQFRPSSHRPKSASKASYMTRHSCVEGPFVPSSLFVYAHTEEAIGILTTKSPKIAMPEMVELPWDNVEGLWKEVQYLTDPEYWMEFEEGLALTEEFCLNSIDDSKRSPGDMVELDFWHEYYQRRVDCLVTLISWINAHDQLDSNSNAARVAIQMHSMHKRMATQISNAITESKKNYERLRQQLKAVADGSQGTTEVGPLQFPPLSNPVSSGLAQAKGLPDGRLDKRSSVLTADDLTGPKLTTSELAEYFNLSKGDIARKASMASKLVGWDANSNYPLAVDALVLHKDEIGERRFAVVELSKGGGKGKGWVFREIKFKSVGQPKLEA